MFGHVGFRPVCYTVAPDFKITGDSFLPKMLRLRLNGFTVLMFYSANALYLAGERA